MHLAFPVFDAIALSVLLSFFFANERGALAKDLPVTIELCGHHMDQDPFESERN